MGNKYLQNTGINLKRLLFGLIFLCITLPGRSQQVTIAPVPLPELNLGAYQSILSMCQDINGFIWMATNGSGLYKYDGNELKNYSEEENNPNSIISNRLEYIFAASDGNIWIGSFENGLDRFNPETGVFTHYTHNSADTTTIRSDSIRAIIESQDGLIWIGTTNGLDSYNPSTEKFTHINDKSIVGADLIEGQIRVLYEDKAGAIWIGCGSPFPADYGNMTTDRIRGGLYKLDRNTGKITQYLHDDNDESSLIDNRVGAIFEDSRGVFWVGTAGDGLHIMDREKGTFQRLLYNPENPSQLSRPPLKDVPNNITVDHIRFINEDAQGCIWIGTFAGGINRYNPANKTIEYFGTSADGQYKISNDDFWGCLKTKDNLLWISTTFRTADKNRALYKISTISTYIKYSETNDRITKFVEDAGGGMWFGSRWLLRKNNDGSYDNYLQNINSSEAVLINNMEPDSLNNLWISTQVGLYYFNTKTHELKSFRHNPDNSNSISSDSVNVTQIDGDGLWIGTNNGLDFLDLKTGIFKHYLINPSVSSIFFDWIIDIKKDMKGNIWIGTLSGLYQMDTNTGEFIEELNKSYLFINSIFEDSQHRIWLGTSDGLWIKNSGNDNFTRYIDNTGKLTSNLVIGGITEDKTHTLWMQTRNGLIRLNPETKNAVLIGKSWDINPGTLTGSIFTSSKGEIFVGVSTGYYHFFPDDFEQPNENITNLYLGNFYLDNSEVIPGVGNILSKPLSQTNKITLNYIQNSFALQYDNIDYLTDPSEKNVLFKLENFDQVWRISGGDNKAYYYNLPPGTYVFRVKASNLYGNWNEKSLEIIINPPWYKTILAYIIYALVLIAVIFGFDRFMRRRIVLKERQRTQERELAQAKEIEKAYNELKTTQSQLIQSEKMASLGELTAGIAHEIQNPLNFVNNFSEVSKELIGEMNDELEKGDINEAKEIGKEIEKNLEKIYNHGRRASSIVKGMLLHSRSSSGKKEMVDINALADEYLRLSYHGFRAKDKTFNADFKTEFYESLPKINVIPQDIGRVLLNLINNAFYAVNMKDKNNENRYRPLVVVITKLLGNKVEIRVQDNGDGIPDSVKEKIFQPFYTTKPTGQGTGLGLSLSYDIIKTHGGEIKVESKEGEGTEFIIQIPTN